MGVIIPDWATAIMQPKSLISGHSPRTMDRPVIRMANCGPSYPLERYQRGDRFVVAI